MTKKRCVIVQLSTLLIALSSEIAMAADKTPSASFAGWPLILFLVVLVVFRKKLFAEATVAESDHQASSAEPESPAPEVTAPVEKPKAVAETKAEKTATKPKKTKAKAKPNAKSDSIDLSADDKQCQGSTAKGTRCKRTTSLDKATVTVDGKTYDVTVCSQHNNDKLKIFSGLLK